MGPERPPSGGNTRVKPSERGTRVSPRSTDTSQRGTATSGTSIQVQVTTAVVTVLRDARAPADQQPLRKRCDVSEEEFERRHALVQDEQLWS